MTLKRLIQSLDLSVSTRNYLLGVMKVKGKVIRHNLIPYAFVRKMVRTMGCFRNLISAGFVEEAQVFGRVLIGTRINFEYFLQLAAKDCNSAISRVFDTIMLDKLKALHATNFRIGNRRVNRRRWAAIEAHIKKVYGDQIFKQLKQHGFSEMSLEARAIKTRNKPLYDLAYRLYSRSVHATDISHRGRN